MIYVLQSIYILFMVMLILLVIKLRNIKTRLGITIRTTLIHGVVTFFTAAIALFSDSEFISTLFYGLFSSSVTFVLVAILNFATDYTDYNKHRVPLLSTFYSLSGLELLSMVANTWLHHVFTVKKAYPPGGIEVFLVGNPSPLYYVHIGLCYTIVCIVFYMLIRQTIKSPALYRRRYFGLFISFIVVLILDAIGIFTDILAGFSPLFYALLAVSIYELAIVFAPKSLAASLLSEVVRDLETGIIVYDLDARLIYENDLAENAFAHHIFGDVAAADFGKSWLNGQNPENIENATWSQDTEDGSNLHFEIAFIRIFDNSNKLIGFYFSLLDRTDSVNNYYSEKYKATHDELTGLYNGNGFFEQVRALLDKEPDVPRIIAVSNIKDFKMLNDLFGEERGNKVLRRIANVMSQRCIDNDSIPARLMSDRFAICIRKERFSDELFTDLPQRVIQLEENHLYKVVCHVGVYEIVDPTMNVSTMCDRALLAVNTLKSSYTTLIAHYDASLRDKILKEQELISALQDSLKNGEFQIYIQPQIQARDHSCKGGEALVRWVRPTGMVSPADFIPVFERTGLITTLDKYVWELACEKLRQWKSLGLDDYYISVNISPRDFYFVDLYDTFTSLVEKYRISPKNLHLEITESVIMNDVKKQVALINSLRAYGFLIEMDDFGSGYSSLNMLKNLSVDVLKIDMGFLGETEPARMARSRNILKMIVSLSKDLNMEIVSEGVETQEEVDFLTSIGVDIIQGYFFSKPLPVGKFEDEYVPI